MPRFIRFPASAFTAGVLNTGAQTGTVFDGLSGTGDNDVTYRLVNADNVSPEFTPEAAVVNAITSLSFAYESNFLNTATANLTLDLGATPPPLLVIPITVTHTNAGPTRALTSVVLDPAGANIAAAQIIAPVVTNAGDSNTRGLSLAVFPNPGISGSRVLRIGVNATVNRWTAEAFSVTGWTTVGTPVLLPISTDTDPWTLNINTTAGRGLLAAVFSQGGNPHTLTATGLTTIRNESIEGGTARYLSGTIQNTTTANPLAVVHDLAFGRIGGMLAVEFS
jgi:hypothetical protein